MDEGIAKRKNSPIPLKSSLESGTRVFAQESENFMYKASKITFNQYEVAMANAPPNRPILDLKTSSQQQTKWKQRVNEEENIRGMIKLCIR